MSVNVGQNKSMTTLESLVAVLPFLRDFHAPTSGVYGLLKQVARPEVEKLFGDSTAAPRRLSPFGDIVFPYFQMGNVDSLNLFDLDELIIFSFYWVNRARYHRVLDIGANIGLHSIMLDKCGYEVRSYEPDPTHFSILKRNLELNKAVHVDPVNSAVSKTDGALEFVRVLGNTTGSHLAGAKKNPYGELERFPVKVEAIQSLIDWPDLIKLDAEGHEKEILLATTASNWSKVDALVEISGEDNARAVYDHFRGLGVNMFAQKNNWARVSKFEHMPFSHHDGTLFITSRNAVPWDAT